MIVTATLTAFYNNRPIERTSLIILVLDVGTGNPSDIFPPQDSILCGTVQSHY